MKSALQSTLIVCFSAYAGCLFANAASVEVLDSVFSVSGYVQGFDFGTLSPYNLSYDESSSSPVGKSVTYGWFYNGGSASSNAGFFDVNAMTWGGSNGLNFALATADVTFQPLLPINQLTIAWNGALAGAEGGSGVGHIELTDVTDGNRIFTQQISFEPLLGPYSGSYLIDSPMLPDKVYELFLSSSTDSHYDVVSLDISTEDMTPIPEPSTYAAVLGAAALGFAVIRRRRRVA